LNPYILLYWTLNPTRLPVPPRPFARKNKIITKIRIFKVNSTKKSAKKRRKKETYNKKISKKEKKKKKIIIMFSTNFIKIN
jgi:hypothetical protein